MRADRPSKMAERRQNLLNEARRLRGHNRSSSWSFNRRSGSSGDLSTLLAGSAMTMLREVLPVSLTEEEVPEASSYEGAHLRTRGVTTLGQSLVGPPQRMVSMSDIVGEGEPLAAHQVPSENGEEGSNLSVSERWAEGRLPAPGPLPRGEGEAPENEGNEMVSWLEQNALFIVVILLKIGWSYKFTLSVLIGLGVAFLHGDAIIRKQVANGDNRSSVSLLYVVLFLSGNVSCVYYAMRDSHLHNCLILQPPLVTPTLINTIWCISVTDFIIRFGAMTLKALLCLIPSCVLPSRCKGKFYMLIEHVSLFYRSIMVAPLWVRYLCTIYSDEDGADQENKTVAWVFAVVVTALYLMVKGASLFVRLKDLIKALIAFVRQKPYGVKPNEEQLKSLGEHCPICQDDYTSPLMLHCKHIFCENCVLMWFDRERTCPMCRAVIATTPKWRNGATSFIVQLF